VSLIHQLWWLKPVLQAPRRWWWLLLWSEASLKQSCEEAGL
jgi:hypothetical protein